MARKPTRFTVEALHASSDKVGEIHFAVRGPTVDDSFANAAALAQFIESALNAAYAAFAQSKQ